MIALYIVIAILLFLLLFPLLARVWVWYKDMWITTIEYIKTGTWWLD